MMAAYSYKPSLMETTGVCQACIENPEAEKAYHDRMAKIGEDYEKRKSE
jgi:hypothetical protein